MKAEELKGKTSDELKTMLVDLKKKQFNLRFQRSQGQLENTAQIRAVRRTIARVKTFLQMNSAGVEARKKASATKKKTAKAAGKTKSASSKKSAKKADKEEAA